MKSLKEYKDVLLPLVGAAALATLTAVMKNDRTTGVRRRRWL